MPEENIEKNIPQNIEKPDNFENNNFEKEGAVEKREIGGERIVENKSEKESVITEKVPQSFPVSSSKLKQSSDKNREKQIENILEVDLAEVYLKLSPENKKKFKNKGEETARSINNLLEESKIKVKKIISLIRDWLKIIPGVNKFFIEQLTKKKLDEIMKLKNK